MGNICGREDIILSGPRPYVRRPKVLCPPPPHQRGQSQGLRRLVRIVACRTRLCAIGAAGPMLRRGWTCSPTSGGTGAQRVWTALCHLF